MTRELDPQLIEAVARGLHADAEDRYGIYGAYEELFNEGYTHFQDQAIVAITSADAHRAPAVREAVERIDEAWGAVCEGGPPQDVDAAYATLLTLLGAQEGDDA